MWSLGRGVAGCGRDDQERAVKQWLADNEPNKVRALSLTEDGFLDTNASKQLLNEPRRTDPDDGGRTPSENASTAPRGHAQVQAGLRSWGDSSSPEP